MGQLQLNTISLARHAVGWARRKWVGVACDTFLTGQKAVNRHVIALQGGRTQWANLFS